jgi:hypothetical protein
LSAAGVLRSCSAPCSWRWPGAARGPVAVAYLRGPAEPRRGRGAAARVQARPGGLGMRLLCAGRMRAAPAARCGGARRAGRCADPVRASALSAGTLPGSPAPMTRKVCTASLAESSQRHCERPWRTARRQALAIAILVAQSAQNGRAPSHRRRQIADYDRLVAAWRVAPWRLPRVILCAGGFGADRSTSPGTALRGQGPDENDGPKFAGSLERGGHARRPAVEVSPRTSSTRNSSTCHE